MERSGGFGRFRVTIVGIALAVVFFAATTERAGGTSAAVCPGSVRTWVDQLAAINERLNVGLSFTTYTSLVTRVEAAYSKLSTSGLSGVCKAAIASGDKAMKAYAAAERPWGECIKNPALKSCDKSEADEAWELDWDAAATFIHGADNFLG